MTVGIRARTTHSTSGSVSRSRGCLVPQPPVGIELSTGTPRGWGGGAASALLGVAVPGVDGGVNAGERREAGGACVNGVDGWAAGLGHASSSSSSTVEEAGLPEEMDKSDCCDVASPCNCSKPEAGIVSVDATRNSCARDVAFESAQSGVRPAGMGRSRVWAGESGEPSLQEIGLRASMPEFSKDWIRFLLCTEVDWKDATVNRADEQVATLLMH